MITKVEIGTQSQYFDAFSQKILKDIHDLGLAQVSRVTANQVYYLLGNLTRQQMQLICEQLLVDPVTQFYALNQVLRTATAAEWSVEITYNPGVMDPVEESARKGITDLGLTQVEKVKTAVRYYIQGELTATQQALIVDKILANKVIQHVLQPNEAIFAGPRSYQFKRIEVPLLEVDDAQLAHLSRVGQLYLNLEEMRTIQAYFQKLDRQPTDLELEVLAQTWSEHCVHKTFRGRIEFNGQMIDNLLKQTIMKVTQELNKPWCVSVFKDNAGVITFDDRYHVCFKVETHNHPSALEPYGGASTGIGGVIRDPMGTGLGAKPILNTDVFCFGPPDYPRDKLPAGTLHPRRVFRGVHAGVRDYGNRMGIPTANGALYFDERYVGNPLVFCGNVGLIPVDRMEKTVVPGDVVILIGGRTGRDGIHGATFSSAELTTESEVISSGAVQIGNAITEKKVLDTLLQARDAGLYRAITDVGGGGLSSAVGELCQHTGVRVALERIPLKYQGLTYTEIWISEAQERMVIAVPPANIEPILKLFAAEDVEATVIAEITADQKLVLEYQGQIVCDLEMQFLHDGLPRLTRRAVWNPPEFIEPDFPTPPRLDAALHQILAAYNVCSKEAVIRQYDHEVQGGSVLKPLQGVNADGPGDACIVRPIFNAPRGIIVSNGFNSKYGLIDPYHMAASAIDEALRQIIAVGGNLDKIALLDNFCWGNTDKPDRLGGLVRAAQACYDVARIYETPFISGKDSLNNEFQLAGESIAIPPTLLISAISVIEDVTQAVSMDVKAAGDLIYLLGETKAEMGGSHYYFIHNFTGNRVPQVDAVTGKKLMQALSRATAAGLVRACHDCSEGGLGVAAAEMAFAGGLGIAIELAKVPTRAKIQREDVLLFSESNSRFLVEVAPENRHAFETILQGNVFAQIGQVNPTSKLVVQGLSGQPVVDAELADLKESWQRPLRDF
ncbi:phosphoribosylformylglycinamidine synthase subunit PurL [candidate division KSB1 bacterium]|nr:phosphoribosylformylglycinamidine synthase subunit PurL [candidate division KSB1 bacterium]